MSARSFAKKLRIFADKIEQNTSDILIDYSEKLAKTIAFGTPIDSGQAVTGWDLSDTPSNDLPSGLAISGNEFIPRSQGASTGDRAKQEEIQKIEFQGQSLRSKKSNIAYITNNVSYINDLNEGSSRQAPSGFVRIAIDSTKLDRQGKLFK